MNVDMWTVMWARGYADGFADVLTSVAEMAASDQFVLGEVIEELEAERRNLSPTDKEPESLSEEWDHGHADGFDAALRHVRKLIETATRIKDLLPDLVALWNDLTVPEEQESGSPIASPTRVRQWTDEEIITDRPGDLVDKARVTGSSDEVTIHRERVIGFRLCVYRVHLNGSPVGEPHNVVDAYQAAKRLGAFRNDDVVAWLRRITRWGRPRVPATAPLPETA